MNYQVTAKSGLRIRADAGTEFDILGVIPCGDVIISPTPTNGFIPVILEDDTIGWVSQKFLIKAPDIVTPTTPPGPGPQGDPPWVAWMRSKLGVREVPGGRDNPEILTWDRLISNLPANMIHDSTPWCAICVHAAFHYGGYPEAKDIDSAAAVDWLKFGIPVTIPKLGDVVVFDWSRIGESGHHVALVLSVSGGLVHVIGGNQGDAVTLASYSTKAVMGYRRAA